jgi:hypothetical protein
MVRREFTVRAACDGADTRKTVTRHVPDSDTRPWSRPPASATSFWLSPFAEIERGRYLPGLDMAIRLANGLGVTLTEIVGQWEGARGAAPSGGVPQRVSRRRMAAVPLDVPQEDVFRRVRGLWELMSPERRDLYLKQGKALVAAQWKEETRGEFPRAAEPPAKPRRRSGGRHD